ncbi:MAG: hypothetical protein WC975_14650 [Phycisphaerae bacterium]
MVGANLVFVLRDVIERVNKEGEHEVRPYKSHGYVKSKKATVGQANRGTELIKAVSCSLSAVSFIYPNRW